MRLITIAILLAALAAPDLAAAQAKRGATGGAPVGHRQPAAQDVPPDQANPQQPNPPVTMSKEDRALDRALKGICRGC